MGDRELGTQLGLGLAGHCAYKHWVGIQNEKESANAAKIPPKA